MAEDVPVTQRDIEALRTTLDKLDRTVDGLPDRLDRTYVRKDVIDPVLKNITDKVGSINEKVTSLVDWQTWAQRLVLGMVIVAVLGLVLVKGGG